LVADIQQLANAEGGSLQLRKEEVDLRELAQAVCGNLSAQAYAKKQTLTVAGDSAVVYADRERMRQVLVNLVSNAIKYTPEGGQINVETENGEKRAMVRVSDNGIGIAETEQALIFERFYRADASRSRDTGGAGIGLAIAKAVVTAHGGAIAVTSKLGQGSCFTVTLPKR